VSDVPNGFRIGPNGEWIRIPQGPNWGWGRIDYMTNGRSWMKRVLARYAYGEKSPRDTGNGTTQP
jgi:hypothetical protein